MRRLAVADIHGCADKLASVLAQARYQPGEDRLFLLGDYIDRGPQIPRTVEMCRELEEGGAVCLMGNHDAACATIRPDWQEMWLYPGNGSEETLAQYGGRVPGDVRAWLAARPLWHEEPDCILVHAGLRPGRELAEQAEHDLLWIREDFWHGYRGKLVIFGHTPTFVLHGAVAPWFGRDKIGIDTGAVFAAKFGGCLTLMDLDTWHTWTA